MAKNETMSASCFDDLVQIAFRRVDPQIVLAPAAGHKLFKRYLFPARAPLPELVYDDFAHQLREALS